MGGRYKDKSGNCVALQLWAYVSIGRNALAPRLGPSPPSLSLSSLTLSPFFAHLHFLIDF